MNTEPADYNTGPICLDELVTVLGEYPIRHRWNGWLCPRIDALAVVTVLDAINAAPEGNAYGYDYTFSDDGILVLVDRQYRDEDPDGYEPESIAPDADGLYDLGAYSWTWSEDPETANLVEWIRTRFDRDDFLSDPGGWLDYYALGVTDTVAACAIDMVRAEAVK